MKIIAKCALWKFRVSYWEKLASYQDNKVLRTWQGEGLVPFPWRWKDWLKDWATLSHWSTHTLYLIELEEELTFLTGCPFDLHAQSCFFGSLSHSYNLMWPFWSAEKHSLSLWSLFLPQVIAICFKNTSYLATSLDQALSSQLLLDSSSIYISF